MLIQNIKIYIASKLFKGGEFSIERVNKFSEFTGIWKDRDITQKSIREKVWKVKYDK